MATLAADIEDGMARQAPLSLREVASGSVVVDAGTEVLFIELGGG